MKRYTKTAFLTAALALAGCATIEEDHGGCLEPLQISVSTEAETKALITGRTLPQGSKIGVTLTDLSGTAYMGTAYRNIAFTAQGTSGSQTWKGDSEIMLAQSKGTLHAYYPHSQSVRDLKSVSVSATSALQTDYMYADPCEGLDINSSRADLTMKHALAAIRLDISRGSYSGTGKVTSVSVSGAGIATGALLDATTGSLSSVTGAGTAISPSAAFTLSSEGAATDIIAVPTGSSAPVTVTVVMDGTTYTLETPATMLQQGKITTLEITAHDTGLTLGRVSVYLWMEYSKGTFSAASGYRVSLGGDMSGISFCCDVDSESEVSIVAAPCLSRTAKVNPVTLTGDAVLTQMLDEDLGNLHIAISALKSDVTVNFSGVTP